MRSIVVGAAIGIAMVAIAADSWAVVQCPGRIIALGNDATNSEVAAILSPEHDCGCGSNRFVVPGAAAGSRAIHADLVAALLSGMRVSLGYDHDTATAPWCYLHNISLMP